MSELDRIRWLLWNAERQAEPRVTSCGNQKESPSTPAQKSGSKHAFKPAEKIRNDEILQDCCEVSKKTSHRLCAANAVIM